MLDISIYIRGPGSVISFEAEVIRRALLAEGYDVTLIDECRNEVEEEGADNMLARRRELNEKYRTEGESAGLATIKVEHLPWGG